MGGAGLDEAAEGLEEVVGVVAAEEVGGVEVACAHAGDDFGIEERAGGVGGAVFAVGAAGEKGETGRGGERESGMR